MQQAGAPVTEEYKQQVEDNVKDFIENLRLLHVIIEDHEESHGQEPFRNKINELVGNMISLDGMKDDYHVEVPIGVLNFIDEGKNPDLYTKQSLADCYENQQKTDGKKQGLEKYRIQLETGLQDILGTDTQSIESRVGEFVHTEIVEAHKEMQIQMQMQNQTMQ